MHQQDRQRLELEKRVENFNAIDNSGQKSAGRLNEGFVFNEEKNVRLNQPTVC